MPRAERRALAALSKLQKTLGRSFPSQLRHLLCGLSQREVNLQPRAPLRGCVLSGPLTARSLLLGRRSLGVEGADRSCRWAEELVPGASKFTSHP